MASGWVFVLEDTLYIIISMIYLTLQLYYIGVISGQFRQKLRDYRMCVRLNSLYINGVVKFNLLYNYKTVLTKCGLIIGILSFEIILFSYVLTYHSVFNTNVKHKYVIQKVHMISPNCSVHPRLGFYYHYPISRLLPIIMAIMLCTLINLISLLTTYLKKRYYVHPIRKSLIRYAVWWSFQVIILLACSNVYTIAILFTLGPALAFVNWIYLIYESKQLAYILRSKIRDILYYEWDKVHYKQSKQAYNLYIVFTFLYTIALFTLILTMLGDFARPLTRLVFLDQCYFRIVYQFKFPLHVSENFKDKVSGWVYDFETYTLPILSYISFILLMSPFLIHGIWRCLTRYVRNRITPIRYTPIYEGNNNRLKLKVHKRKHIFKSCCT